jgi:3-ketosteroid 9alpha-monooxygenase subunit A
LNIMLAAEVETAIEDGRAIAFPEGWFQIAYSEELATCGVLPLHYFGQELVLFRTASGKPQVIGAFCAHLGAHLGKGGRVDGELLRCPFHEWGYATSGKCTNIPYSDRIPARGAEVGSWPTQESSGIVFVWYSPKNRKPHWPVPTLAEYGQPSWTGYDIRGRYQVRTTAHEILENVVDFAHAVTIHGAPEIPKAVVKMQDHRFHVVLENDLPDVGGKTTHRVTAHGIGIVENHATGHGEKAFFTTYTPIDRNNVDVRFSMAIPKTPDGDPGGEIARHGARTTIKEFEKDLPIWENKIFRHVPLLCKEDGPIGPFRVWARQFYG